MNAIEKTLNVEISFITYWSGNDYEQRDRCGLRCYSQNKRPILAAIEAAHKAIRPAGINNVKTFLSYAQLKEYLTVLLQMYNQFYKMIFSLFSVIHFVVLLCSCTLEF